MPRVAREDFSDALRAAIGDPPRFPIGKCKKCGKEVPDTKQDGKTVLFYSYECYCND